ncbi:MAG: Lpp/OprI family alanine-zipper lipoprotein [Candidatus Porifericomitaceae bacterium WSBS_2022_MAG_OTU9]
MVNMFRIAAVMCIVAVSSACANSNTDKLADIERKVERAFQAASSAGEKADRALSVSSEASYAAEQAQSTAESALRCCNENSDKIERAFEKVTRK